MSTKEQMSDLHRRSRDTLTAMGTYSREMLVLSITYIQERLAAFTQVTPKSRTLVCMLDAHNGTQSTDDMLTALKTRWPDLTVSEIIFDKQSNRFFVFTE